MMIQRRMFASSVVLNQSTLWVTGGEEHFNALSTTEFITLDQAAATGPKLPFTISHHGMIKLNDHAIYIIGGWQNGSRSRDTWIVDLSNNGFDIKKGPSLNQARKYFSCGKMLAHDKVLLVVAGGYTDTVEILDPSSAGQGWIFGKFKYQSILCNDKSSKTFSCFRSKIAICIKWFFNGNFSQWKKIGCHWRMELE